MRIWRTTQYITHSMLLWALWYSRYCWFLTGCEVIVGFDSDLLVESLCITGFVLSQRPLPPFKAQSQPCSLLHLSVSLLWMAINFLQLNKNKSDRIPFGLSKSTNSLLNSLGVGYWQNMIDLGWRISVFYSSVTLYLISNSVVGLIFTSLQRFLKSSCFSLLRT